MMQQLVFPDRDLFATERTVSGLCKTLGESQSRSKIEVETEGENLDLSQK